MIGELLDSKGYNAALVVVDCLSKQVHAIPTVTSLDSARVMWLFLEHGWRHHRLPEEVISDQGPTFISNFSCDLATLLGVKLTPSTSYHPQTNGQTECVNQEIEVYLQVFVSRHQDNWADWLPLAEFTYNNKVSEYDLCYQPSCFSNVSLIHLQSLSAYLRYISKALPCTLTHCTLNSVTVQFHTAPTCTLPLFVCCWHSCCCCLFVCSL
jgi:hypothetical protein